ncbi:Rv3235 family protein, partial [Streptomyces minutiscleroticus]|uniref:Rv3235 family protein n=1 Tax=Streptomyces minutiscleroticus TaxID=68238 RepID=UPI0033168D54
RRAARAGPRGGPRCPCSTRTTPCGRPGGTPPRRTPGGDRPPAAPPTIPGTGPGTGPGTVPGPGAGAGVRPTDLFADRLLAVLSGQRPVHCMLRHTAGRAYDELARLAEHGPLRTHGARPVVRDIGYYVPRTGALEVFARIGAGEQLRALAFRLEQGADLRWRCTAVELGVPHPPHTAPGA